MKTNKGFSSTILILILSIIAVGGVYYAIKKSDSNKNLILDGYDVNKQSVYHYKNLKNEGDPVSDNNIKPTLTDNCVIAGCYNNDCVDPTLYLPPTCVTMPPTPEQEKHIACYKKSECKRQMNGQCGWTQTPELLSCFALNPRM